jgi:hypothetical protein
VSTPFGDPTEGMGLGARVILHLAGLASLGPNDVAPLTGTQQGMVGALGVRQASLAGVLQRLLASDVVAVERRFVAGADRRMKVYHLRALGDSAARGIGRRGMDSLRGKPPR